MGELAEDRCPHCNADLDDGPIPENIREHYSPPYRWSRKIALVDIRTDRAEEYACPDCKGTWPRFRSLPRPGDAGETK